MNLRRVEGDTETGGETAEAGETAAAEAGAEADTSTKTTAHFAADGVKGLSYALRVEVAARPLARGGLGSQDWGSVAATVGEGEAAVEGVFQHQ